MSNKLYLKNIDWSKVAAATVVRLIGQPIRIVAPPGGAILYEPLLSGGDERGALEKSLQNREGAPSSGSLLQDPEAVLDVLGTLYARIGIVDQKGRCLGSVPIALGAAVTQIIYKQDGATPSLPPEQS